MKKLKDNGPAQYNHSSPSTKYDGEEVELIHGMTYGMRNIKVPILNMCRLTEWKVLDMVIS